jgi:hypothetical protein
LDKNTYFAHNIYIQQLKDILCRGGTVNKEKIKKTKKNIPDDIPIIWVNIVKDCS